MSPSAYRRQILDGLLPEGSPQRHLFHHNALFHAVISNIVDSLDFTISGLVTICTTNEAVFAEMVRRETTGPLKSHFIAGQED